MEQKLDCQPKVISKNYKQKLYDMNVNREKFLGNFKFRPSPPRPC
jgi:hypothetical protein